MSFSVRVQKRLGSFEINLGFETGPGITALFGPSGSGKTSVLNMIAGLLRPDSGRIAVAGELLFDSEARINLPPERRRAGYIFQDGRLFPHMRVRANLLYGRRLAPADDHHFELDFVTRMLGIGHLLDRWPRNLSGGEAQRVAIGRALLASPRFLLLDEPLSYLDAARREEIIRIILRLRDELALPMLYVTHDPSELVRLDATRIDL